MKNKIHLAVRHGIRLVGCVVMLAIMFLPCITFAVETRDPKDHEELTEVLVHYGIEAVDGLELAQREELSTVSNHLLTATVFGQEDWEGMTVWQTATALWECGADLGDFKDELLLMEDSDYGGLAVSAGLSSFTAYMAAIILYLAVVATVATAVYHVIAMILALTGHGEEPDKKMPFTAGLWWAYAGLLMAQPLVSLTVNAHSQYSVANLFGSVECRFRIFFEGGIHYLIVIIVALVIAAIVDAVAKHFFNDKRSSSSVLTPSEGE